MNVRIHRGIERALGLVERDEGLRSLGQGRGFASAADATDAERLRLHDIHGASGQQLQNWPNRLNRSPVATGTLIDRAT